MTIYFDNAATTKPCPEAVEAVTWCLVQGFGNPSSGHALGREAAGALRTARERVAAALGCDPGEVIFTSGGTEADNMAIRHTCAGTAAATSSQARPSMTPCA